jgi:hypothetical protein
MVKGDIALSLRECICMHGSEINELLIRRLYGQRGLLESPEV